MGINLGHYYKLSIANGFDSFEPFSAWCPLKGQAYLNKRAAFSCKFVLVRVTF